MPEPSKFLSRAINKMRGLTARVPRTGLALEGAASASVATPLMTQVEPELRPPATPLPNIKKTTVEQIYADHGARAFTEPNSGGSLLAHTAAANGDIETLREIAKLNDERVQRTLDRRDSSGRLPIQLAALGGKVDALEFFVERGGSAVLLEADGHHNLWQTPLQMLAFNNDLSVVDQVAQRLGPEILSARDTTRQTLAGAAAEHHRPDLVLHLASHSDEAVRASGIRALTSDFDHEGNLPAHNAASRGDIATLQQIGEHSHPSVRETLTVAAKDGRRPADIAAEGGRSSVLQCIAEHAKGALTSLNKSSGMSTIHTLAFYGHEHALSDLAERYGHEILCNYGRKRETVAHYAAESGQINVLEYLAAHTDPNVRATLEATTFGQKKPIDVARENAQAKVEEYLSNAHSRTIAPPSRSPSPPAVDRGDPRSDTPKPRRPSMDTQRSPCR